MSKNTCKILGITAIIVSIFFIIGGLYLPRTAFLMAGILLLITGIVFYKILKTGRD